MTEANRSIMTYQQQQKLIKQMQYLGGNEEGDKELTPQEIVAKNFIREINLLFPNDDLDNYFGFKYDLMDKNLYSNDFWIKMKKYLDSIGRSLEMH